MEEKNINIPADVSIKIFNAVKEFKFGKITEVMEFLDWQYALPKPHYPDEAELSSTAFQYLIRAYNGFWESENKHEKFFIALAYASSKLEDMRYHVCKMCDTEYFSTDVMSDFCDTCASKYTGF